MNREITIALAVRKKWSWGIGRVAGEVVGQWDGIEWQKLKETFYCFGPFRLRVFHPPNKLIRYS